MTKKKYEDLIIFNNKKHIDKRGYFKEILQEKIIKKKFPFLVMSFSRKGVIRGLHLQMNNSQGKYISVIKGKIYDIAVDLRKKSKTYGKKYKIILSEKNNKSLYIPPGFAHGFQAMEHENYIIYNCTKYRDSNTEISIKYNDADLNIKWPLKNIILSKRDLNAINLKDYIKNK